ncbi:efflux RND transporter periplasmic adaptor subunit [Paucibacter sp. R3-3]|uniref:Efflux RND transporter periplasmic adaptor subunit n=1 Tax=Roseateles agri TaxID=3098619 RepID=A0ABU5DCE8_9BURK|nr:efflux RND transporter periplasmic adaptor subunit [Paucibacter sp. R3-3]MDY0743961.1 efflux RND transporter periplasmic adaptor subunit [Paucibacter sp. R3-3]
MKRVTSPWILFAGAVLAVGAVVLIAAMAGFPLSRSADASVPAARPAPLVSVVRAEQRDLVVKLAAQGHVVALNQVDVRPQLGGTIRGVHFREGDEVRAGQQLFTIDASDASAQLMRSEANFAQIEAQVDDAARDLGRTRQLAQSRFYSTSAVDTSASKLESLQAQLKAAQADVAASKLLMERTRIAAPMSGLTGALAVHPGSLAQPGATAALVTVVQIDPIGVEFTLPESQLAGLLAARAAGSVRITLRNAAGTAGISQPGTLVFVNNTVNTDSGTITLKASFPNAARTLWPGAYVELEVDAGTSPGAIVLPPQAVLDGPQGRFVFALDREGRAQVHPVELLRIQDQLAVVQGLKGGERVVAEGGQGLKPGSAVKVAP